MPVQVKGYTSSSLVLLAFDWPAADLRDDFVGFGIERTPGFRGTPSGLRPIRQGYWWDSGIGADDQGSCFRYRVVPMIGADEKYECLDQEAGHIEVQLP
jgi:hypothetical protein